MFDNKGYAIILFWLDAKKLNTFYNTSLMYQQIEDNKSKKIAK